MDRRKMWLGSAVLVLAGLFVYAPGLRGGWLWDDDFEITQNHVLKEAGGWWRIWLRPEGPDYFPLKTELQWCEWHLWGERVMYYHWINLGFHLLGAFFLWRILAKLFAVAGTGSVRAGEAGAFFGGLLFVVHPLAVESVAWISELKNVMSLPPLLLAFGACIDGEERRGALFASAPSGHPPRLTPPLRSGAKALSALRAPSATPKAALAWFVAAMLCKSSVVMFPMVLLLYGWWRRGSMGRREVLASLPFFGISLVLGAVTVWFQSHRAIAGMQLHLGGWLWRLGSAGMAVVFYFFKCVVPAGLMPIYPDWGGEHLWFQPVVSWCLIGLGLGWLWRRNRLHPTGWSRHALFGVGFFLINLLPVLGLVPMSYLRISRVADHLCYLPLLGLVGLAAAAVGHGLDARRPAAGSAGRAAPPYLLWFAAGLVVCVLGVASRCQAGIYRDPESFWSYAVERNPDAWLAHNDLGVLLESRGKLAEASAHLQEALRSRQDYAVAENNLGDVLLKAGRLEEAISHFQRAVRLQPDYAEAYCNWGDALVQTGRYSEAIERFEQAMRLKPDYAEPYSNRGLALSSEGRQSEAIADFEQALRLQPDMAEAELDLGLALSRSGRLPEAISHYREAVRLNPQFREAHNNLANALLRSGKIEEAIAEYEEALRLDPNYVDARNNLTEARRHLKKPAP